MFMETDALYFGGMVTNNHCSVGGCTKHRQTHGKCLTHARQDPTLPRCTYPACGDVERAKGHCDRHYIQQRQGIELKPFVQWNLLDCRGPLCTRSAKYRDGYCKPHHEQRQKHGEVWVIGTRKHPGRAPVTKCIEPGCPSTQIAVLSRCLEHARQAHGECWLPWCTDPGHHVTGLCDKHRRHQRAMMHSYGIGWQRRLEMAEEQGHQCPLCGAPDDLANGEGLHIDHDHTTGRVRGLLCGLCNRGIGLLGHDLTRLRKAITYLEVT